MGSWSGQIRQLASRPAPLTEDRYGATSQKTRKKASPLFNSHRYDIMLLWADIIFWNNSSNGTGKKYIFFTFFIIIMKGEGLGAGLFISSWKFHAQLQVHLGA